MKRKLLLYIFLTCACRLLAAWQPIVRNFTAQEYEAGTQNWQVLQAPNGWMYMANHEGLLEYDGCTWHLCGVWHSSPLYSMAMSENGEIYAGGSNEFGKFVPDEIGRMRYVSLTEKIPSAYRSFGEIWRVYYDEGTVYLQTRHYIFVYNADGHVDVIDPAATIYSALVQNHSLYVATSTGLSLYSGKRLHPLSGGTSIMGAEVSAMAPYDDQSFLIATDFAGLYLYDGTSVKPFHTAVDDFLRYNQVFSLAVGKCLAIGTVQDGIVILDKDGQNPDYISRSQGLQNVTALSVYFDADGNLWSGLDQGVSLTLLDSPLRFLRFGNHNMGTGYSYAEHDGNAYFATNQGLYVTSLDDTETPRLMEGGSGQAWKLCKVREALYCCHNRGLFEVKGRTLRQLDIADGVWSVQVLDEARSVACTYSGFYVLHTSPDGSTTRITRVKGSDETALFAYFDQWKRLWTITSRGVEYLVFDDSYTSVSSHLVLSDDSRTRYSLARVGDDLIVSGEGYLAKATEDGQLVEDKDMADRLSGAHAYQILQKTDNGCFVYMYNGRLCYRANGDTISTEAMNAPRFFVGGFANLSLDGQGRAVVGGVDGFYALDISRQAPVQPQSQVFIRSIKHDELGVIYGERDIRDEDDEPATLSLESGAYMLHVTFASNLVNRQGAMFQTRLYPEEKEFSDWTGKTTRDIALLTPGHHTLEVRMHVTDASDAVTSLDIYVEYPWYVRWWAILMYVLAVVLLLLGVMWVARRRIRRSQQLIAAEKEAEIHKQEVRILQLEQEQAQFDLKSKSRELNSVLLNQINRNEINASLHTEVRRIIDLVQHGEIDSARKYLYQLDARLSAGVHQDKDWKRFEDNFDFINDRFISKLSTQYPWMSKQEKKLCVYVYMGLQTKEIAPLLNLSTRGVEMMRYRLRQKMNLEPQLNLKTYFEELLQQTE